MPTFKIMFKYHQRNISLQLFDTLPLMLISPSRVLSL